MNMTMKIEHWLSLPYPRLPPPPAPPKKRGREHPQDGEGTLVRGQLLPTGWASVLSCG